MVTKMDLIKKFCGIDMDCGMKVSQLYDDCSSKGPDVETCVSQGMTGGSAPASQPQPAPAPQSSGVPKTDAEIQSVCGDANKGGVNKTCTDAFKSNVDQCNGIAATDPMQSDPTACIDNMNGVDAPTKSLMQEALNNKTWQGVSLFGAAAAPVSSPVAQYPDNGFDVLSSPTLEMCSKKDKVPAKACREAVMANEQACNQKNQGNPVAVKQCIDGLQGVAGTIDPATGLQRDGLMREVMSTAGSWNQTIIRPRETDGRGSALRLSVGGAYVNATHSFAAQVGSDCGSEDPDSCSPSKQQSSKGGGIVLDARYYPLTFVNDDMSFVADLGLGFYYSWEALNPVDTDNNKIYENYNRGLHRFAATVPDIILWPSKRFGIRAAGYFGGVYAPEIYGQAEGKIKLSGTDVAVLGAMAGLIVHLHDNVALGIDAVLAKEFSPTGRKIRESIGNDDGTETATTVNNNLSSIFFMLAFKLEFAFLRDRNLGKRPKTENVWFKGMDVETSSNESGSSVTASTPVQETQPRAPLPADQEGPTAPGQATTESNNGSSGYSLPPLPTN